jgi:hypothetical protein
MDPLFFIPQKYNTSSYHASSYMTLNKYDESYTVIVCPIIFIIHVLSLSNTLCRHFFS